MTVQVGPEYAIRVLDHFIIGDGDPYSFAEHGLMS
jgi:DNA repair protein RadC